MTTIIKTIFEKAYVTEAQCETAIKKAFGDDSINYVAKRGDDKKWRVLEIPSVATVEPIHPELAAAELEMQAQADRIANATMGVDDAKPRFSICERPTKKVWNIADTMPKASRKEVMAECVRQGIAYGTARTQYQAWFKASQECMRDDIRKPHQKGE